jgi:hypothetical protein
MKRLQLNVENEQTSLSLNPHGKFTIEVSDRILFVDGTGPFNEATVREYKKAIHEAVAKLTPKPWAFLGILRAESLFTPEAESELTQVIRWRKEMGMTHVAVALIEVIADRVISAQMSRIYQNVGVDFALFESLDEARAWLESLGYNSQ